jgi:hypothetical protein
VDIPSVRAAIKQAINRIDGLDVDNLRMNPNPPCAIVYPEPPFDFEMTFDGNSNPIFTILLLVPYVDTDDAQDQLDELLSTSGPRSVKAAIDRDSTLGGAVSSATVKNLKSYQPMQLMDGGTTYLSAEITLDIYV